MVNDEGAHNQAVLAQEPTPAPSQAEWYLIHSMPLKERSAAAALHERLGLTVYVPEVPQRFRGGMQPAPLFPRYLFIRAHLGQVALSAINATPGVLRLVSFDERPQPVPSAVIRQLHQRVEQLNDAGGLPPHTFQPGAAVRLTGGPLCGLEAVFVGPLAPAERVHILLEFMGRLNEVEVEAHLLEPAGNLPLVADLVPVSAPKRGGGRGARGAVCAARYLDCNAKAQRGGDATHHPWFNTKAQRGSDAKGRKMVDRMCLIVMGWECHRDLLVNSTFRQYITKCGCA